MLPFPIPPDSKFNMEKKIQEFTNAEIAVELAKNRRFDQRRRGKREAIKDGFAFATGRIDQINWGDVYQAFRDHSDWIRRCNELETEWHLRISMAFGSLLFVILGAPIGILFARRDFLSAFMTCFLPIIAIYYPLMLGGVNMSKEGHARADRVALDRATCSWPSEPYSSCRRSSNTEQAPIEWYSSLRASAAVSIVTGRPFVTGLSREERSCESSIASVTGRSSRPT